jgi:hypothetical protein
LYVRAKKISGRQYLYLVEGKRLGHRVRQVSVYYIGPLWKLYAGVPKDLRRKIEKKLGQKLDWKTITDSIVKTPISFEELQALRRSQYSKSLASRKSKKYLRLPKSTKRVPRSADELFSQREKGELDAIARLAAIGFKERFEQIDERTYRMG